MSQPLLPPSRRLLFTGSRDLGSWDIPFLKRKLAPFWRPRIILVHGAARGGDTLACQIWEEWGGETDPHPVTPEEWARVGNSAGHKRNERMVDLGANWCVAFPIDKSSGTRGCARYAKAAGIPTFIYEYEPRVFTLPVREDHAEDW